MEIRKLGHSCIMVLDADARILIDPGRFSSGFENISDLTAVLVTHAHSDHIQEKAVRRIAELNPAATFIAEYDGAQLLREWGIDPTVVDTGDSLDIGTSLQVYRNSHAIIHPDLSNVGNAGYVIGGRLYHPGDALFVPPTDVEILALPTVAPWMKAWEAVDYLREISPRTAVPIHEAVTSVPEMYYKYFTGLAQPRTTVRVIDDGDLTPF